MSNINFLWLLLLFIPFIAFDLWLHFFIAKKIGSEKHKTLLAFNIFSIVVLCAGLLAGFVLIFVISGISVAFVIPWLLLLLIPAVACTLIPYFMLSKKYRKTRNRITSIVLHLIVMLFATLVLSGMTFSYKISNDVNEIILLVDVSETLEQSRANRQEAEQYYKKRDDFVKTVLNDAEKKRESYKIGVVTFGFDQKYAVPLTSNIKSIYNEYLNSDLPDTSATDIAAALVYTKTLFTNSETAKIVLVTDGKETDEEAARVIKTVAAGKTRIDTVLIDSKYGGDDVQLYDVVFPEYHVNINEECVISVKAHSTKTFNATVEMYDDGAIDETTGKQTVDISAGDNTINFKHTFTKKGVHEILFKIIIDDDLLEQNNQYVSYYDLQVFNRILILERSEHASDILTAMLTADEAYDIEVVNVYKDKVPDSVDKLRMYDQVIFNNISNADIDLTKNNNMPKTYTGPKNTNKPLTFAKPVSFVEMLYTYVNDFGGGFLTVGGNKDELDAQGKPIPNAYNRSDMYGTLYQEMLPVQAINYTPPLGVVIIIDRSGSMGDTHNGTTYLDWAKSGAAGCLDALTERDYFGLMTLDSERATVLEMTPRTHDAEIRSAINSIQKADGGTVFPGAIERAGQALRSLKQVDRRHIIIVSDGQVPENQRDQYEKLIKDYYDKDRTTLSVVGIGIIKDSNANEKTPLEQLNRTDLTPYERMLRAAIIGHGRIYAVPVSELGTLGPKMREDLNVSEIKEVNHEPFYPTVYDPWSPVLIGIERGEDAENRHKMTIQLDGFYGVKVRKNEYLILTGEFDVPIYAQWKFGSGMVGSFMCDLNGTWSSGFLEDENENGKKFVINVIKNLMPLEDIRPSEATITLTEYNYINQMTVYWALEKDQYVQGQIINISSPEKVISLNTVTGQKEGCYVTLAFGSVNNYSTCDFVIRERGIYKIVLNKYAADGTVIDSFEMYKAFSYSAEYNTLIEDATADLSGFLKDLAKGNGSYIADLRNPTEVFAGFVVSLPREFDPRFLFIILAIVLVLLDVAVRKFKFKWPHEIYRQYKEKKALKKDIN